MFYQLLFIFLNDVSDTFCVHLELVDIKFGKVIVQKGGM